MAIETVRVLKSFQTQALAHRCALEGLLASVPSKVLAEQVNDAVVTAQNHIDALQHAITVATSEG